MLPSRGKSGIYTKDLQVMNILHFILNNKKLLYTSLCPGLCDPQEHASLLLDWFVWLEDWALGVGEPDAVHSGAQVFKKKKMCDLSSVLH